MRKLLGIVAVLGLLSAPVMAQQILPTQFNVPVNLTVAKNVSMQSNQASITLDMAGGSANADAADGSLACWSNTPATISVQVTGTLPQEQTSGGGIYFFIANPANLPADANTALKFKTVINTQTAGDLGSAYNPAGALAWTNVPDNHGAHALNSSAVSFATNVVASPSTQTFNVIYAADSPGEVPLPSSYNLTDRKSVV